MTESSRAQQVLRSLEQYEHMKGSKETLVVPLQRGNAVLPVITIPLSVPVLNAKSFRIAPQLADHPQADLVHSDPFSPEAQRVVTELVRRAHRHADELKEALKDGQDQPGVITREGVLINANTRCVLMRELAAEGDLRSDGIRVAVLPADVLNPELFDLEAVLQKQKEHKDEYNLVSELMMLRTLHEEGRMTEQQIARRQRLRKAEEVTERFRVLDLMERARHLVEPPLPLRTFARERDKFQNWKELLKRVSEIESGPGGPAAADRHIQEWLTPYLLGQDSVHVLRNATEGWVDRHVFGALAGGDDLSSAIADSIVAAPPTGEGLDEQGRPEGLELLDFGGEASTEPQSAAPGQLLHLALQVIDAAPGSTVTLPDGTQQPAEEVKRRLETGVKKGLDASKARIKAGNRFVAPERLLASAKENLSAAIAALDDVVRDPDFVSQADGARSLLDDLAALIDEAGELLDSGSGLDLEDAEPA